MASPSQFSALTSSLDAALQHHQAGRFAQAEQIYQKILNHNPNHADALHLLGMVRFAGGLHGQAEQLIRHAVAVQPQQPVFHSNLGIVLAAGGQLQAAILEYRLADSLAPASPQTLNNLGVALHARGDIAQAVESFKRAIVLQPDYTDARNNLLALWNLQPGTAAAHHAIGDLLNEADRSADAIPFYQQAIELHPQSAETCSNLGNALFAIGQPAEALTCYQNALKLSPDFPQALNNLANALKELGRLDEAIVVYQHAAELQPDAPEPLSNLGNALRDSGQWESAVRCYHNALMIRPDHPITHNNIGNAWCERGDWSAAVIAYERALAFQPDYADAINNLGTALEEIGQRDRAMDCYVRAQALAPKAVSPPWNIALLQLLRGDYENGWRGYENRWRQKKQCKTWRDFPEPMLSSLTELKGSRVLLHAEQGFGDAIQFCRYATLAAEQGAEVFLECPGPLARLFCSLRGVSQVIARGDPLPAFDFHCPLMSLPKVFGTTLHSVPSAIPYLQPDPTDAANWQAKFASQPAGLRVGLVWAGQSTHQKDRHRSLTLNAFAALAIPGASFFSLQVGEPAIQSKSPPPGMQLIDWTADLHDFANTAALIAQLDLVITVDTAVCHLAGAMGKPVWVLIAFQPDWRWLLDRDNSPWYPIVQVFRQLAPDDWESPLAQVTAQLQKKLTPKLDAPK